MKRRARERQEKRENMRPILKRLRAAFLRSFMEDGKKMVCVKEFPGVTGNLLKSNSHFDPTETGSRTTPSR